MNLIKSLYFIDKSIREIENKISKTESDYKEVLENLNSELSILINSYSKIFEQIDLELKHHLEPKYLSEKLLIENEIQKINDEIKSKNKTDINFRDELNIVKNILYKLNSECSCNKGKIKQWYTSRIDNSDFDWIECQRCNGTGIINKGNFEKIMLL